MEPRRCAGEHSTVTNKEKANHQLCGVHRAGEDFIRILVSLTKGGMSGTELFSRQGRKYNYPNCRHLGLKLLAIGKTDTMKELEKSD